MLINRHSLPRMAAVLAVSLLAGCSLFSGKKVRNEPAPLASFKPSMTTRVVWSAEVGKSGDYFLAPAVADGKVYAAGSDGTLVALNAADGKALWRSRVEGGVSAGVGVDGSTLAVTTVGGAVLAFDAATGKQRWKAQASTEVLSAPAVGAGVVIVRSMDNRIAAYDADTGNRRWVVQRSAPALVLRAAPGIVMGDGMAFVGLPAGRLLALSATTGVARWDAAVAEPRGATELERVADVSGMPVLLGRDICAAAYQGRLACIDAANGSVRWTREFSAAVGPAIDQRYVFGADESGVLSAFSRDSGGRLWRNDSLKWRGLSAPASFGRAVVVGDREGYLHFLSREDGAMLARLSVGSGLRSAPVVAGQYLIVQTAEGKVVAVSTE